VRAYRLMAGATGWFALALQLAIVLAGAGPGRHVAAGVNFFSYFTILSNLAAASMLTLPPLAPASAAARFFERGAVKGAVTLYMTITGLIYTFVLAALWSPSGWQFVADALLHDVMPALVLAYWLFFVERGTLGWSVVPYWLVFPLAYSLYTLLRGPWAAFYPYPFMDVAKLGLPAVLVNMAGVTALFVAVGLVLVAADRLLGPRSAP
jgi:hypothetical protein